jgi:hypothetical protein
MEPGFCHIKPRFRAGASDGGEHESIQLTYQKIELTDLVSDTTFLDNFGA